MTRSEVLALIDRRRDTLARRDLIAFGDTYAPMARLESPLAGSVVGREAIVRASAAFFSAFEDASIDESPPLVDGDRATIMADVAGSQMGPLFGLPASGRAFRFSAVFLLTCENGLNVHERRIYDFTGLLVQIGVLKARPA